MMGGTWKAGAALLIGLALQAITPAWAADPGRPVEGLSTAPAGTYIATINGNFAMKPTFLGSDSFFASGYPTLSIRRFDEPARFQAPDDGVSFGLFETPDLRIGPVFRLDVGRYHADDKLLYGLRKNKIDLESGLFIEYWPVSFIRTRVELRHGFRDNTGFVGNIAADYVQPWNRFTVSLGPRLYLGDQRYNDRNFGIRPAEAAVNGAVFAYRPGGGLTGVGVTGSVTYKWSEAWSTTGYANYTRLVDDAAKSPIVTRIGTRDQITVGAKISYSFGFDPFW